MCFILGQSLSLITCLEFIKDSATLIIGIPLMSLSPPYIARLIFKG